MYDMAFAWLASTARGYRVRVNGDWIDAGRVIVACESHIAAGLRPEDTDVFCLYDPTSFEVLRQFEMMGVFPANESQAISRSRDKLRSLQLLSRHDIGIQRCCHATILRS